MSEFKTCPFCAEKINASAIKCKYCGEFLNEENAQHTSKETTQLQQSNYVKCDSCGQTTMGKHSKDLWGYHIYSCTNCGYKTKYPLGSGYTAIYYICIGLFVLWVLIYLFIDATAGLGLLGLLGIPAIFILIHNSSLKSKHPNYKAEEFNSQKR